MRGRKNSFPDDSLFVCCYFPLDPGAYTNRKQIREIVDTLNNDARAHSTPSLLWHLKEILNFNRNALLSKDDLCDNRAVFYRKVRTNSKDKSALPPYVFYFLLH